MDKSKREASSDAGRGVGGGSGAVLGGSLPKGGGAIRAIGEKFAADPVHGTGRLSVPIVTSAARELTPAFSLTYDSGSGNGLFGIGWQFSPPMVARRTDTGLPRYRDTAPDVAAEDADVFLLTGGDDLVPFPPGEGGAVSAHPGYHVRRYRPRVEGDFARVERWTRTADGDVHWRTLSADNLLNVYGRDGASRVADPADPHRIFSWLLCETRDDRGNAVRYDYRAEDAEGVDTAAPHEQGRGAPDSLARGAGRSLHRVRYGNRVPLLDGNGRRPVDVTPDQLRDADWMFEVVLDYGDHPGEAPTPAPTAPRLCRADPFSTHRPAFEVRTYRLCQRVLMFHHFPDEPGVGQGCLVAATAFTYRAAPDAQGVPGDPRRGHPGGSFLESVTVSGFQRSADGGYTGSSLPPLTFTYTHAEISAEVRHLDGDSLQNLPAGLDERAYDWVDLDGEGLSGVLSAQGGAWYYKPNLGDGRLGPVRRLGTQPSLRLNRSGPELTDLDGNGQLDLVRLDREPRGFHTRTADGAGWEPFTPFASAPAVDLDAPSTRRLDLTGDGLADLLTCEDTGVVWYPGLGARGFGPPRGAPHPDEDGAGPRPLIGDSTHTLFLADMSGDGLTDLVRVRDGEIRYWPNLGHGHFGAPVVMNDAPRLDTPDGFDPGRVRLADVDGSGTTDLLYVGRDGVRLWYNRSGNGWGPAHRLPGLPHLGHPAQVRVADLLGNGTACLVWSSPLPADADDPLRYIDLMGGTKPHLLTGADNHMGAETRVRYASSTAFYLADRRAGRPWHTRLPFPVHVVEQSEHIDHVRRTRFTSRYSYHHGYFDGVEREFRGFGLVEQHDTEAYEGYAAEVARTGGAQETDPALFQPPVTTRSWFHTGAHPDGPDLLERLTGEFYLGERHLPAPELPDGLDPAELRECVGALRGRPLRTEVYSFDGSPDQEHPYAVTESAYAVERLQHRHGAARPAYLVKDRATMTRTYDRDPSDPRVAHTVVLDHGPHGEVLRSASIVHGRRVADPALPAEVTRDQRRTHITCVETDHTPDLDTSVPVPVHRLGVPFESRDFEITGLAPAGAAFTLRELREGIGRATPIAYEDDADGTGVQRRPLAVSRHLFRSDALAPLPLGQWDTRALPYESYGLAFTARFVTDRYAGQITDADLTGAGYVRLTGGTDWWIPSGTAVHPPGDPALRFFRAVGARSPFGVETVTDFDAHDLLPVRHRVVQAPWNTVELTNDYRVLAPFRLADPNGNRAEVEYDTLGLVVRTALLGKEGAGEGDTLADPTTRLEYDLFHWSDHRSPNFTRVLAKERHGDPASPLRESYVHLDGGGTPALTKARTAPGEALTTGPDGSPATVHADPRWIGSGRTVVNNKGLPVKSYEPYFSPTHAYDAEEAMRTIGSTAIRFYDPVGRLVRTDLPDGTFTRTEFGQWASILHDANDTVRDSRWYAQRGRPDPLTEPEPQADPERRAAWLAARHAGTPAETHLDSLGRPVLTTVRYETGATASVRGATDLTGRRTELFDQLGRAVASGFTGMAGTPVLADSAERGRRWTFTDITGALVRTWDEHGQVLRAEYDELHRPVSGLVRAGSGQETVFQYTVYGDRHPEAAERNLLGTVHQSFDPDGSTCVQRADLHGIPTEVERLFTRDHTSDPDWRPLTTATTYAALQTTAAPLLLTAEPFTATSSHDALGRPERLTLPDGTAFVPAYDESGLPASIAAHLPGGASPVTFLEEQDYDALGRRRFARFGNDVTTRYTYDPATTRLTGLLTGSPTAPLQDLHYTYDPVGNVTQVRDDAQQTHFFANQVVTPATRYEYDALYQLVRAFGREHAGGANDTVRTDADVEAVDRLPHVNDAAAVRTYSESYEYDLLGNLTALRHRAAQDLWTRRHRYAYQADPADRTNRLLATSRPGDPEAGPYTATYDHDVRGNMTRLRTAAPDELVWDAFDRLRRADLGGGGTAHYRYGGDGQRTRKVIERPGGEIVEHLYLGPLEIHRRRQGTAAPFYERHTLHLSDNAGRVAQIDIKRRDDRGADPANPLDTPLVRYQYGNHLGSATLETDDTGHPISYEEYHPYGTTSYRSGRPDTDLSLKRYRFAGKERDAETGLYYVGARYYAPWLGRWTSADPGGFVDGLNLYRYCGNNPVMFTDPDGREKRKPKPGALNPAGEKSVFLVRVPKGRKATVPTGADFEKAYPPDNPTHPYTPGSAVFARWGRQKDGSRYPIFNAEWLDPQTLKPRLPRVGEPGYVTSWSSQPDPQYGTPGDASTIKTIKEHVSPRAQDKLVGDAARAESGSTPTMVSPKAVSDTKTPADNAATRALKAQLASGKPVDQVEGIAMPGLGRMNAANKAHGSPIPQGSAERATLAQLGYKFEDERLGEVQDKIAARTSGGSASTGAASTRGRQVAAGARGTGNAVAQALIPGFAEAAIAGTFMESFVIGTLGVTSGSLPAVASAISAAPTTFAWSVTLPAIGGAVVGNVIESGLRDAGAGEKLSLGGAVAGAALTGAAIGTLVPIPGVSTVVGAAAGAVVGVVGFALSRWF
ncbi:SpvB/TcaC N-terminal domain-containing protein [Streptomyces sp. NPDC087844]|uniref:SpvB/TcaC N-terminal domain-containing protein n=1 Tax=Streptomyces sp. NPDC087844 TaxID=3365805 RepID=UPI00382F3DC3